MIIEKRIITKRNKKYLKMAIKTYHFNTGVKPFEHNPPAGMAFMKGFKNSGNGVYVIPFRCNEVPDGYKAYIATNNKSYPNTENYIRRKVISSKRLKSQYVYFKKINNE